MYPSPSLPPAYIGVGGAPADPYTLGYTTTPSQIYQLQRNVVNSGGATGGASPSPAPAISPTTDARFARVAPPQAQPPQGGIPTAPIGGANPLGNGNPFQAGYSTYMRAVDPNW